LIPFTPPKAAAAASPAGLSLTLAAAVAAAFVAGGCVPKQQTGPNAPLPPPPPAVNKYVEGVKAYRSGDKELAVVALEDATHSNPKLITARSLLGDLYKERGDYSRAADQYKAVTELDPYTAKNYYKLGVAYHLLQKLPDAVSSYLTAIKLDPKDWESRMNVGLVYLAMGKKDLAVNNLSEATIINPGAGVAFGNLAIALDAQARYPEAETAYKRALELDPNDTASLGNLGKNFMRQNKVDQALVVLKKLADSTDSASSRKLYADALVMAKKNDEAIALYDNILKEDGKYYPALNGKGSALIGKYEQGLRLDARQKAAAVAAWKESLALKPQQPKVQEMVKQWSQ
jgi:tetratricopeptide (TPR) repeat protein